MKVLELTLQGGKDPFSGKIMGNPEAGKISIKSFEDLFKAYSLNVDYYVRLLARQEKFEYDFAGKTSPFFFLSMLFDHCIDRALPIFDGGLEHLGGTIETYGNTNTGDSFYVIKKLVFEDKKMGLEDMVNILDNNFEGYNHLREERIKLPKYGNNIDEVDEMLKRVHVQVCESAIKASAEAGLDSYLVVNINNSANTILGAFTSASPDGRKKGESLANGNTPMHGRDTEGITSLLNSLVKMPVNIHAGASQNIKFSKEMFKDKLPHTEAVIRSFFKMGGAQLMITCVGRDDLENAMKDPDKYSNLLVRVGGFSARFVELDYDVQMEILSRTLY
jgi:pyruvate-formate lyase